MVICVFVFVLVFLFGRFYYFFEDGYDIDGLRLFEVSVLFFWNNCFVKFWYKNCVVWIGVKIGVL